MPDEKNVNVADTSKLLKLFCMFAPVLGFLLISNELDNDFYFLYKTGENVLNNGFATTDFLSMHSSMHIISQQWLSAVVFYFLYSKFSTFGVIGLVYVCYALFCVVMYKLTNLICEKRGVACLFSFIADLLVAVMYEHSRPQTITLLLIVTELYLLESFVRKNKIIYLAFLPLISLALINMHAAMWGMMFVFAAPYAAAAIPVKVGKFRQEPCCSFVKLLLCGIVCLAVGFINPYGTEAMTYIFSSFGDSDINALIVEMQKPSLANAWGIVLFSLFALMFCATAVTKNRAFSTRFVLLFAGTAFMAMLNAKSVAYFLAGGIPAFSYMFRDARFRLKVPEKKADGEKGDGKKALLLVALLVIALGALVGLLVSQPDNAANTADKENAVKITRTEALGDIVKILDRENCDDFVIFTDFGTGQYLEFKGYHPYIDGRAELFLKKNNKEFDYLNEYVRLCNAKLYYKDFLNKYNFNYIIVEKTNYYLYTSLSHDTDYELIYESDSVNLYRLKAQSATDTQ